MASKTLPDLPESPMDCGTLVDLLGKALRAALRDLRDTPVQLSLRLVSSPKEEGLVSNYVNRPFYRCRAVWDRIAEVWKSLEAEALVDYLWSHGALKKNITRDDEQEPTKDAWGRFVWGDLVHGPLLHVLDQASSEALAVNGTPEPWAVGDDAIDRAAIDVAGGLCKTGRSIVVCCPTLGLQIPDGAVFELEQGVRLEAWTPETRSVFLTRHHREYLSNDMAPWFSSAALCIERRLGPISDTEVLESVALVLDRVKWACKVASSSDAVFQEGPVVVESPSGWRGATLRRGDTLAKTCSLGNAVVKQETAQKMAEHLRQLDDAISKAPQLETVLQYFGRSCNAPLPRDALLDAAIGLEMLLVPDPGESTYKFRLHGAAVLGAEVYKDLGHIYGYRSRAAHGDMRSGKISATDASRARFLLAKALHSVAVLINSEKLDVKTTGGKVAEAIRDLVRKRAAGRI